MKQELEKTIAKLESDPLFAITVDDNSADNPVRICANLFNKDLVEKYGSAKGFFEALYASGVKKIKVVPKKRNGYDKDKGNFSYRHAGVTNPPFEIEFEPKQPQNQPIMNTTNNNLPQPAQPALNGGLSGADVYKVYDHQRIEKENYDLKAENKVLIAKNESLKEENLKAEILGVKKVEQTEATAKLMAGASPFIPLLQALLMGARGQDAQAIPLNQAVSPLKQFFLNQDDDLLADLEPVIRGFSNAEFDAELKNLLIKFNLLSTNVTS